MNDKKGNICQWCSEKITADENYCEDCKERGIDKSIEEDRQKPLKSFEPKQPNEALQNFERVEHIPPNMNLRKTGMTAEVMDFMKTMQAGEIRKLTAKDPKDCKRLYSYFKTLSKRFPTNEFKLNRRQLVLYVTKIK
jgi:hypothetical protein